MTGLATARPVPLFSSLSHARLEWSGQRYWPKAIYPEDAPNPWDSAPPSSTLIP